MKHITNDAVFNKNTYRIKSYSDFIPYALISFISRYNRIYSLDNQYINVHMMSHRYNTSNP